jgi:hypothetical protein
VSIPAPSVVLHLRRNETMPETKKVTESKTPTTKPGEKPHSTRPTGPTDLTTERKPVVDTPGAMPVDMDRP